MAQKDLIIVRAGNRSLHSCWLDPTDGARPWDLLVCPYEELAAKPSPIDGVLVSTVIDAPAKYKALTALLGSWTDWRNYRYVMLADDDLFASQQTWSRFFERAAQCQAKLAQPALLESSYFSHGVTVRNTEFIARRVSFVEAMTPCFRVDVLGELLSTFALSTSGEGWGLVGGSPVGTASSVWSSTGTPPLAGAAPASGLIMNATSPDPALMIPTPVDELSQSKTMPTLLAMPPRG